MKIEDARKILDKTESADYRQGNRITRGLQILSRHWDREEVSVEHDTIYAGAFEATVEKMTEAEVNELALLGWFGDGDTDSWQIFT